MVKPWLEVWSHYTEGTPAVLYPIDGFERVVHTTPTREQSALAAAAPDAIRALLWSEWGVEAKAGDDGTQVPATYEKACPSCGYDPPHNEGCRLDAALTKAGLPDQASRDEARKMMWEVWL